MDQPENRIVGDEEPLDDDVIAAWADEAIRRSEAARRGEIKTIAGDEVFRDQPTGKSRMTKSE